MYTIDEFGKVIQRVEHKLESNEGFKLDDNFPSCGKCNLTSDSTSTNCPTFNIMNSSVAPFKCSATSGPGNCNLVLGQACDDDNDECGTGLNCVKSVCSVDNVDNDTAAFILSDYLNNNTDTCGDNNSKIAEALKNNVCDCKCDANGKDKSHMLLYAMLIVLFLVVGGVLYVMHGEKSGKRK